MEHNGNADSVVWSDTEAGKKVQARLTETRTLKALDHLLQRIDTLEQAVDRLGDAMRQGPGLIAMVGDMADEAYRKADARGVSVDERLRVALALAERLTAPTMVSKLDGLLTLADQAPGLLAMMADMADEAYRKADAGGVNIDERLQVALQMAEKLTAPEMAAKLDSLLQLADQAPGMIAMAVDWLDENFKNASENGFDPTVLAHVAGAANTALTRARAEHPVKSGGIFKIMGALRDEDRQKGMGFLLNFLKYFGQKL
jgi:hypothetical protein